MSVLMHGGNLKDISSKMNINIKDLKDFSSNLNPLGPPKGLLEYLRDNINDLLLLPDYDSQAASGFISELINADTNRIVPGNGTTEFIRR
ncbi:MAG: pyridoxal phosphate-dependent aminotransferase, partial [Thermodesulfobacteriota bacterium]